MNDWSILNLLAPHGSLLLFGLLILIVDSTIWKTAHLQTRKNASSLLMILGCGVASMLTMWTDYPAQWEGVLLVYPEQASWMQALLIFGVLVAAVSREAHIGQQIGEYFLLLTTSLIGMLLMIAANHLLLAFVSLELLSLSLYALVGLDRDRKTATEAALKYFLYGSVAAACVLYGFSILYGLGGSLKMEYLAISLGMEPFSPMLAVAVVAVALGLGFKLAAAPFHLWAPDSYHAAPTPTAGFLASASKVAGLYLFANLLVNGMGGVGRSLNPNEPAWAGVLAVMAAVSMLYGNVAAITQQNIKRLLAYSAIAHAGYLLLGILAAPQFGMRAAGFYVITYGLATMGLFALISLLERETGREDFAMFTGLSKRDPWLAMAAGVLVLSLAGIPPLAGFFGKFNVFVECLKTGYMMPYLWLVALAILTSVVSLYYYLQVLKATFVKEPNGVSVSKSEQSISTRTCIWVCVAGTVLLGIRPDLLLYML